MQEHKKAGALGFVGEILITERNEPVRQIYKDAGFSQQKQAGAWTADLAEPFSALPPWLHVDNKLKQSSLV